MSNLENKNKVEAANKVLAFAKQQGFTVAFITYEDEDESMFDDPDSIALEHDGGDEVLIRIHLTLDEDFQFEVSDENEVMYK